MLKVGDRVKLNNLKGHNSYFNGCNATVLRHWVYMDENPKYDYYTVVPLISQFSHVSITTTLDEMELLDA